MTTEELNALIAKAEGGDVAAMDEVANVYVNDANFKDANKAFYWYSKSAETGDMLGMSNLGSYCYAYGNGVLIDLEKALYWLTRAAKECDNAWSREKLNTIGVDLQYGNNGRTIDLPLAFKFYMAAADCGDSAGMCNAAYCLAHGIGTDIDYNKTFELYTKAAELGNQYGYSNLAWCYLNGNGVEKNISEAIKWFTDAAEKYGNIYSMKELTNIYCTFDGYVNQELAAKWFLELIKRDCNPNSSVYENTGYNKNLYEKIKNAVLNSTTEEEMMSSMSGGMGGSLLGGAMSFTTSNAKTYISQAEAAIQRNIEYKEEQEERARLEREEEERRERERREAEERVRREAEERALLIKNIETDYKDSGKTPITFKGTTFNIPDGTKRIGDYALEKCYAENIVIPETVTSIGINAFRENTRIKSIHIPNSVISIGKYAFSGCQSLSAIDIPNGLTHIEEATFSVTSLTDIKIPDSVTNIGNWAFTACQNLKTLELPNSLISLGDNTVDACLSLETVIVPKGVKDMVVAKLEEADLLNMPKIVEK